MCLAFRLLLDSFGLFVGCGLFVPRKLNKYLITMSWLGFIILPFYTNEITSVLTVQLPKAPYDSLRDLLFAGYKILYPSQHLAYTPSDWEKTFGDFRKRNISQKLSDAIVVGPNVSKSVDFYAEMLTKHIMLMPGKWKLEFDAGIFEHQVQNNFESNMKCYILPDRLTEHHGYFMVYNPNRHWILETYKRFLQSGIGNKAHEWSKITKLHYYNSTGYEPSYNMIKTFGEYINLPELLPILKLLVSSNGRF